MITPVRRQILEALVEMSELYPDMRFGQTVENIATWAYGADPGAIWDVEDEQFLEAMLAHVQRRNQTLGLQSD